MTEQTIPYGREELREVLAILTPQHKRRVLAGFSANCQGRDDFSAIRATADAEALNAAFMGAPADVTADLRLAVWAACLDSIGKL